MDASANDSKGIDRTDRIDEHIEMGNTIFPFVIIWHGHKNKGYKKRGSLRDNGVKISRAHWLHIRTAASSPKDIPQSQPKWPILVVSYQLMIDASQYFLSTYTRSSYFTILPSKVKRHFLYPV